MKYIILCGGIGKRCNQYSLPKPLNMIQGRHMIEYIIDNIPSSEVYIIYNIFLNEYHFQETIVNKCKNKKIYFSQIDYLTRGAVESAYVGIQNMKHYLNPDENIVFIDNDNIHSFANEIPNFQNDFIGYSVDYKNPNYSFIQISNNKITNIEEKNKISEYYCCGFYGFTNYLHFLTNAKELLYYNNKTKNEFYFSQLYKQIIQKNGEIEPFLIENTKHIGTYPEIYSNHNLIEKKTLRICFDLDNTLVTYPTIPGDYSTVRPIYKNIELLNRLKKDGHEIIIHTARRMATHKNNIGKVIKDIALVTLNTLDKYNIIYDELIFGKPIADIYIDDRAINPYINDISFFGIFYDTEEYIPNKIENNKYNKIKKKDNYVIKTGPYNILKGELFYYENIPSEFKNYFPTLIDYNKKEEILELKIEYINGIPLFYLYKNELITPKHIDHLFDILNKFHLYSTLENPLINIENIKRNYIEKLKARFNKNDYHFENAETVLNNIIQGIEDNYNPIFSNMIHGDFWFSNIIFTYEDEYKFIDMKGQVDNILTIEGDIYYDYGKLYQSILGYDLVLTESKQNNKYMTEMKKYFLNKCREKGLDLTYLHYVTKGLIFGTMHAIANKRIEIKERIWELINE